MKRKHRRITEQELIEGYTQETTRDFNRPVLNDSGEVVHALKITKEIPPNEKAVIKELTKVDPHMSKAQSDSEFLKMIDDTIKARPNSFNWAEALQEGSLHAEQCEDIANSVKYFIEDNSYKRPLHQSTLLADFYCQYEQYCVDHGIIPLTPQQVCFILKESHGVHITEPSPCTKIGLLKIQ